MFQTASRNQTDRWYTGGFFMNAAVIGAGHVGLVAAACLSDFGLVVTCVDRDSGTIDLLQRGGVPFYEPGLEELVRKNVRAGRLSFSNDGTEAIRASGAVFVAVSTDLESDGGVKLDCLEEVAKQFASVVTDYKVFVIKSTVPVGTAAHIAGLIAQTGVQPELFDVVSNPEFLREGSAIECFMRPDRVLVGARTEKAFSVMRDIYRPLYLIEAPIIQTTNETAELTKYTSNAFLAMKISFINEISNLCDALDCDVHVVAKTIGLDKRIGPKFLHPGPGYGGYCLPKDTRALLRMAEQSGVQLRVVEGVVRANVNQPDQVISKVRRHLHSLDGSTIAILGLAYKSNTDDVRDSPAIHVSKMLLGEGAHLRVYDPMANGNARRALGDVHVNFCTDPYDAAKKADCLLVLTEWNEFRNIDLNRIKSALRGSVIVDGRNIYDPRAAASLGFTYEGIGRRAVSKQDTDTLTALDPSWDKTYEPIAMGSDSSCSKR
jgi:UDPglucose 6-dehydrogenase